MNFRSTCLPLFLSGVALAANPDGLVRVAVHGNPVDAQKARAELRAMGPSGLEALFIAHADAVANLRRAAAEGREPEPSAKLQAAAIDAVARQKDASFSRLYWYTSLDEALAAATATSRPILSLRLLGDLGEDLSCANSRFFRTALYANTEVSKALREGFVLHWESVRPAPRITIDYGDGRRIERTITGNSLHYILTSRGEVVDVLPGLYGPAAFLAEVRRSAAFERSLPRAEGERALALKRHHARGIDRGERRELPDARLDESSRSLMRAKSEAVFGQAFEEAVLKFEESMTQDQRHNEVTLRPLVQDLLWRTWPRDLRSLTDQIYAKVFRTPRQDPWLGLVPALTYAALDGEGRRGAKGPSDEALRRLPLPDGAFAGGLAMTKVLVEGPLLSSVLRPAAPNTPLPPATGIPGAVPTTISPRSR